jgi:hypothetical protein
MLSLNPGGTMHDHFDVAGEKVATIGAAQASVGVWDAGFERLLTGTILYGSLPSAQRPVDLL